MEIERTVRASDGDRERAAERLRHATTEGRLSVDELAQRLDAVYAARTVVDVDAVLTDLPDGRGVSGPPRVRLPVLVGGICAATVVLAVLGVLAMVRERSAMAFGGLRPLRHLTVPTPLAASHQAPVVAASVAVALVAVLTCAALFWGLTRSRARHRHL